MNKLLVNTPQNVQIEYNIASVGKRVLAYIIDTIIRLVLLYALFYFTSFIPQTDKWMEYGIDSVVIFIFLLYPLILEILLNGQTIGKLIMRIRVGPTSLRVENDLKFMRAIRRLYESSSSIDHISTPSRRIISFINALVGICLAIELIASSSLHTLSLHEHSSMMILL